MPNNPNHSYIYLNEIVCNSMSLVCLKAIKSMFCYIYQPTMFANELEVQNALHSISQATHYIVDWSQHRPINKFFKQSKKQPIAEQALERQPLPSPKKQHDFAKQLSERFNLRKYQKKLETINQISYPMADKNLFSREEKGLNYERQSPTIGLYKRKLSNNGKAIRVVEAEFLRRKLEMFQKKNADSQRYLRDKILGMKLKGSPKCSKEKRCENEEKKNKGVVNEEELETIKKMVVKNAKRYSVPNLNRIETKRSIQHEHDDQLVF